MSKCPHIHRRGNILFFRISVPSRFRSVLCVRELTQSLRTQNRTDAIPAAYKLASEAKILFNYLDSLMAEKELKNDDIQNLIECLDEALVNSDFDPKRAAEEAGKENAGLPLKALMALKKKNIALELQEERHQEELRLARLQAKAEAFDKLESLTVNLPQVPKDSPAIVKPQNRKSNAPNLSIVFEEFIQSYKGNGSRDGKEHLRKIKSFSKVFTSYANDKKIDQLTQKEVNQFFKHLIKYPGGRGGRAKAFDRMSFFERIEYGQENGMPSISPKAFVSNYLSPASLFFKWLRNNHEDYAPSIALDHIDYGQYGGRREKGEDKQRALRIDEIKKLMCSDKMKSFVRNPKEHHKYWLVMIGLHTGARVNEICQLNPQYDIIKDGKTGIWYFNFTEETPGGVGVDKRHKNNSSKRKVPIHSVLIECGIEKYLMKIKEARHDRLFNMWKPKDGKASYRAEEFFRDYLRNIGLRDDTLKDKVTGMHSLRSTFISHSVRCMIEKSSVMGKKINPNQALSRIRPIVGHEDGTLDEGGKDLSMTAGYLDKSIIKELIEDFRDLRNIIEEIDYKIVFPKPE